VHAACVKGYIRIILMESYRNRISSYGTHSPIDGIKSWVQVNTPNVSGFYDRQGLSFTSERQSSCEEGRNDPIGSSRVNM
jgi:hypothetical protein